MVSYVIIIIALFNVDVKDTHREKVHSNKTTASTKSMNMDIWLVGILNQL